MRYLVAMAMTVVVLGLGGAVASDDPLAKYQWEARPILIFAPDRYDARLTDMKGRFSAHRREFRDRHVIVIEIGGPFMRAEARAMPHGPALRERFGVPQEEFAMILLGKDGEEKLRLDDVADPFVFYDLIDTLPPHESQAGQGDG